MCDASGDCHLTDDGRVRRRRLQGAGPRDEPPARPCRPRDASDPRGSTFPSRSEPLCGKRASRLRCLFTVRNASNPFSRSSCSAKPPIRRGFFISWAEGAVPFARATSSPRWYWRSALSLKRFANLGETRPGRPLPDGWVRKARACGASDDGDLLHGPDPATARRQRAGWSGSSTWKKWRRCASAPSLLAVTSRRRADAGGLNVTDLIGRG